MPSLATFTFIYSTGSSYLSVESDASKKSVKVGCLGMGPLWQISDHTWDYSLTEEIQCEIVAALEDASASSWDECYVAAEFPDLEWELITTYDDGTKKRSFGQGMKSPGFDSLVDSVRKMVTGLSKTICINLATLEAIYFCHVAKGVNCTCTLYRDLESVFEKTGEGERKIKLFPAQWSALVQLVSEPDLPHFGFCKEKGTQFVSRALYLGGKMVSYTYGGIVDAKWDKFENELIRIINRRLMDQEIFD